MIRLIACFVVSAVFVVAGTVWHCPPPSGTVQSRRIIHTGTGGIKFRTIEVAGRWVVVPQATYNACTPGHLYPECGSR